MKGALVTWTARHFISPRVTATGSISTLAADKKAGEEAEKRRRPLGFAPPKEES